MILPSTDMIPPSTTLQPLLSLSTKAKLITRYLFNEAPLPLSLTHHAQLLLAFTSGAALAFFFQRYRSNKEKIQLAVFHVLKCVEGMSEERLMNPGTLVGEIEGLVRGMLERHLSRREAGIVVAECRKRVGGDGEEDGEGKVGGERKRRWVWTKKVDEVVEEDIHDDDHDEMEDEVQHPLEGPDLAQPTQEQSQHGSQEPGEDTMDVDDSSIQPQVQHLPVGHPTCPIPSCGGRSSYSAPFDSDSDDAIVTPTPILHPTWAPSISYGVSYDDPNLYSSPVSSDLGEKAATSTPAPGPKVVKPASPSLLGPPSVDEGSTSLSPVRKDYTPQPDPAADTEEYGVAKSLKRHGNAAKSRKKRRSIPDSSKSIKLGIEIDLKHRRPLLRITNMSATSLKLVVKNVEEERPPTSPAKGVFSCPVFEVSETEDERYASPASSTMVSPLGSISSPPPASPVSAPSLSPAVEDNFSIDGDKGKAIAEISSAIETCIPCQADVFVPVVGTSPFENQLSCHEEPSSDDDDDDDYPSSTDDCSSSSEYCPSVTSPANNSPKQDSPSASPPQQQGEHKQPILPAPTTPIKSRTHAKTPKTR
ncbi:hypothetical protein P153DRAFT_397104 [Dothidotthia symphoricarpi CBS 119687]|uniref:Uncharacterized protein n=1 Tax=Dothidotthia symphoricarpi CBS 119687 TaxID=1392245 RepID=A0A6A6ACB9_9PLEO|nr:uncharacterized protein P153DRAFT_397104 [Dothidotthia symphoricarpi CBS 119687]KAF2128883.1 hypothetical protein P153DRAFT_397104 [Dothidotthia symphoricarpi CBS 119687]